MKKSLITLCLLLAATSLPLSAQRPKNEISAGWGYFSTPQIATTLAGTLGTAFTGGLAKVSEIGSTGTINIEYQRYILGHLAVGGALSAEQTTITFDSSNSEGENGGGDHQKNLFLSLMPSVKVPWFYREHFSMYSDFNIGLWYNPSSQGESSSVGFAWHASPVGMDFGGSLLRGYVEFGLGMRGFAQFGLRCSF